MDDLEKLFERRAELKKQIKEIKSGDLFDALLIITTPSALPNVAGCVQLFGYLGLILFSIAFFDIRFSFVPKLFGFGASAIFSVGFAFLYHKGYGNTDTINRMKQQLKEIEGEIANYGKSEPKKQGENKTSNKLVCSYKYNGKPTRYVPNSTGKKDVLRKQRKPRK